MGNLTGLGTIKAIWWFRYGVIRWPLMEKNHWGSSQFLLLGRAQQHEVLRRTCTHGKSDSLTQHRLKMNWESLLEKLKFHTTLWKLNISRELNMVSFPKFLQDLIIFPGKTAPLQGDRVSHPHTRLWSISTGTLDPFVSFSPAQDRRHAAESTYIFVILRRHLWAVLSLCISQWIGWFSWMSLSFALGNLLFITWCSFGCGRPKWVGMRWWEYFPMHPAIGSGNFP